MNALRNTIRINKPILNKVENLHQMNNSLIGEHIDLFLSDRKTKNLNTYKGYKADIEHFFESHFGKPYKEVTFNELNSDLTEIDSLMGYFQGLYNLVGEDGARAYTNTTINRKSVSVKQILRFLKMRKVYIKELVDLDFITNLPKDTNSIEMIPFDTAIKYAEWLRDNESRDANEKYLLCMLAIDTGLRAVELLNLKWTDFTIDGETVVMRGVGKNNKKFIEKISLDFYTEIANTLKKSNMKSTDNLFKVKYHSIPKFMGRVVRAFGHTDKKYSFHSFKKTSVNMAYRLTGDILEAQRKGRHSSLETTRIYTEVEDYGMTGLISLNGKVSDTLYKEVDHATLLKAIEDSNKDYLYILNHRLAEILEK